MDSENRKQSIILRCSLKGKWAVELSQNNVIMSLPSQTNGPKSSDPFPSSNRTGEWMCEWDGFDVWTEAISPYHYLVPGCFYPVEPIWCIIHRVAGTRGDLTWYWMENESSKHVYHNIILWPQLMFCTWVMCRHVINHKWGSPFLIIKCNILHTWHGEGGAFNTPYA